VPKIIALRVEVGTPFPAVVCSQGKVLLAALDPADVPDVLAIPSRSVIVPYRDYRPAEVEPMLREVRTRGWGWPTSSPPGIRSVAVPVRDGSGAVRAAMNVTVHSAETSVRTLLDRHLPPLRETASSLSADRVA
jgi:IclR family pca regulon transcriptional regulator